MHLERDFDGGGMADDRRSSSAERPAAADDGGRAEISDSRELADNEVQPSVLDKGKGKAVEESSEASEAGGADGGEAEEEEEDGDDDDDDNDAEEEDDEEDEDEEPRLKYARLTQHLGGLYRNGDATSAFLVAGDKMVGSACTRRTPREDTY